MQTTDAPGLREAINRLRRIKAGEDPFLVYGHMMTDDTRAVHPFHQREWVWERQQDDHETIADDWLATHPSDGGEAISEEWLTSIGGAFDECGGLQEWTFAVSHATKIAVDKWTDGTWRVFAASGAKSVLLANHTTRDDLRHLLAALGCATKGTENPGNS